MNYQGVLTKMKTELGTPIQYYLVFKDDFLNVNQLLDKKLFKYKDPLKSYTSHTKIISRGRGFAAATL